MRTGFFESLCFTVHRFSNKQVAQELPEVVGTITAWVEHIQEHGTVSE